MSPEFVSSVTDAVMAEVGAWQARPLEPMYPVVFFDALRVKIREDAVVRNKATVRSTMTRAPGVAPRGKKASAVAGQKVRVPERASTGSSRNRTYKATPKTTSAMASLAVSGRAIARFNCFSSDAVTS